MTLRWLAWIASFIVAAVALSGCHTVEGVGKDIQSVGQTMQRAADEDW